MVILVISIILLVIILALIYFECKSCKVEEAFAVAEKVSMDTPYQSGVSTGPDSPKPDTNVAVQKPKEYAGSKQDVSPNVDIEDLSRIKLSDSETKLFNQLKMNDLNDENINKLIDAGVITEKLVEKFLAYVDSLPPQKMTLGDLIKPDEDEKEHFTTVNKFANYVP